LLRVCFCRNASYRSFLLLLVDTPACAAQLDSQPGYAEMPRELRHAMPFRLQPMSVAESAAAVFSHAASSAADMF